MTLWFCQRDNRTGIVKRRNLDVLPSFTIAAGGVGDSLASGYWLELDDPPLTGAGGAVHGPRHGRRSDD